MAPPVPADEQQRLQDLYAYEILDSDPEEAFDDIVRLAATICGTPWARVNFVDEQRQWTKAVLGMDKDDTPRQDAFCSHTIAAPGGSMVVEDALTDDRFADNPLVLDDPGIRFYAGSGIRAASGRCIGAVCVLDDKPRNLTDEQLEALRALSEIATAQLELRRRLSDERRVVDDLRELDRKKAEFNASLAHDFRTPLTAIRGFAQVLREEDAPVEHGLDVIERSADRLLRLVDRVGGTPNELNVEPLDLAELARATVDLLAPASDANDVSIEVELTPTPMHGDPQWLAHVLDNLIGNAVKYSPGGRVLVTVRPEGARAVVEVCDSGVGIPADEIPQLFDRFFRASTSNGFSGSGIGLAVVKDIVERHGGTIDVTSEVGGGSTFRVVLPTR